MFTIYELQFRLFATHSGTFEAIFGNAATKELLFSYHLFWCHILCLFLYYRFGMLYFLLSSCHCWKAYTVHQFFLFFCPKTLLIKRLKWKTTWASLTRRFFLFIVSYLNIFVFFSLFSRFWDFLLLKNVSKKQFSSKLSLRTPLARHLVFSAPLPSKVLTK